MKGAAERRAGIGHGTRPPERSAPTARAPRQTSASGRQSIVVRHPSSLTVAWAQRVLDLCCPGAEASAIDVLSYEVGTTTRVRLAVEHSGPSSVPRLWFVKLPSLARRARWIAGLPRLPQTEARFYREVAPAVPVALPTVLAAQSRPGRGTTIVLADVTESGASAGYYGDLLTAEQASRVVEQLAHLHAAFWTSGRVDPRYRWLGSRVRRTEDRLGSTLAVPLMLTGLDKAGGAVPSTLRGPALRYARRRRRVMSFLAEGPLTVVHHDVHPGNIFWRGATPGLLDWHLVRIGEAVGDVAYFLATALDPQVRRAHEARLLNLYHRLLGELGVEPPDLPTLTQRYRCHLVYAFEAMVLTLAVGGMIPRETNLELIRRTTTAVADHDAFALEPIDGEIT